jgi:hypothetical protein
MRESDSLRKPDGRLRVGIAGSGRKSVALARLPFGESETGSKRRKTKSAEMIPSERLAEMVEKNSHDRLA